MTSPADMDHNIGRLVRLAGTHDPIAAERIARVRTAVHDAWRDRYVAGPRRRRRSVALFLVAAASVAIAVALWRPIFTPKAVPVLVAHVESVAGSPATDSSFGAGTAVMSGSRVTTSAGSLAMTLTSGVRIRLDASTAARVDSAGEVTLERGALYVDSADAQGIQPGASPISIHTPVGLVSDLGTRFEVRLNEAGLRIRVRDGQVRVTDTHGIDARAGAGEELLSRPDGSMDRRPVAVTGRDWAWVERAAPPFSLDGRTLGELLDWVSREGAYTVTFADLRLSATARATVVHGRPDLLKGLTAAEVLDVVLPTCGLRYHVDRGRVVIEREISPRDGR